MQPSVLVFLVISAAVLQLTSANQCASTERADAPALPTTWIDIEPDCSTRIANQIQVELLASITYLAMGSHFTDDRSYRPALAKFFFASAAEERSHAKMLMEYYLMRGGEVRADMIPSLKPSAVNWTTAESALRDALKLEELVTNNIKLITQTCEGTNPETTGATKNDYHAVDYLTLMLDEQYKSMRELSGLLVSLSRMMPQFGDLGELAFDKELGEKLSAAATATGGP